MNAVVKAHARGVRRRYNADAFADVVAAATAAALEGKELPKRNQPSIPLWKGVMPLSDEGAARGIASPAIARALGVRARPASGHVGELCGSHCGSKARSRVLTRSDEESRGVPMVWAFCLCELFGHAAAAAAATTWMRVHVGAAQGSPTSRVQSQSTRSQCLRLSVVHIWSRL